MIELQSFEVRNPANGAYIAVVPEHRREDVRRAVETVKRVM